MVVTVTDSANTLPDVNAGNDQEAAEGFTVNPDATPFDVDHEDTLTYTLSHSTLRLPYLLDAARKLSTSFTAPMAFSNETDTKFTLFSI